MKPVSLFRQCVGAFVIALLLMLTVTEAFASRDDYRRAIRNAARAERKLDRRQYDRRLDKRHYDRRDVRDAYRAGAVSGAIRNEVRHNARHRTYRHIAVTRRHGGWYHGYGRHHHDGDAFKWLAFTALTLKILDMVNEDQQRRHEQAMIDATTARIGAPVVWRDGNASGRVIALRENYTSDGYMCREFQQEIRVGGRSEEGYGTACLQPDGSWKIVN